MIPAITKKSYRDLSKRKARTIFTILTIALGVAGISMFAIVPLMDEAMEIEIREANIYNVQLNVADVELNETNIMDIEGIDNVESFEVRTGFFTKIYVGDRRNDAIFIGVDDLISSKKISNRSQDQADLKMLQKVLNRKKNS